MASPSTGLPRMASIAACATLVVALGLISHAKTADTIQVWKIGSPYRGDTPHTWVPSGLQEASAKLGFRISVEAFPAKGFAPTFLEAVGRNAAPDILVFDTMGVMQGITTELGRFEGAREATTRRDLIHVTGAFDELLGPARWVDLLVLVLTELQSGQDTGAQNTRVSEPLLWAKPSRRAGRFGAEARERVPQRGRHHY